MHMAITKTKVARNNWKTPFPPPPPHTHRRVTNQHHTTINEKNTPSVDIYPPTACNRCCTTCLQPCLTHLRTSTGRISRSCSLKSYSYIFAKHLVSKQETQLIHNVNWQHGGRRKQDTQYDIQNVFMKLKEVHLTSSVFWLHSEGYCNLQDMHHHTADHRRPI